MTERARNQTAMQIAGVVILFCGLANLAFYFLSDVYFSDRAARYGALELAAVPPVRLAFAIFTGSVSILSVAAALAPRWVGHGIGLAAGLVSLVGAYGAWSRGSQPTLMVVLLMMGLLLPALAHASFRKSRAAWSMLIAMCSVLSLMTMFGAPKVRAALDVGLWIALILPGLLAVGAVALAMVHRDYQEP